MRLHRLVLALSVAAMLPLAACLNTPPPHERALINNELCAQELQKGDYQRATVYCDLGLEFSPQYADLWANKGIIAMALDDKKRAKEYFIKALRYNQEHLQSYQNLGTIYLEEGAYGKAHDNFRRALQVNPDNLESRYDLGLTFMKMDKLDKAKKEFNTILAVNPNVSNAHHNLGIIAFQEHDLDTAADHLAQAAQLTPDASEVWHDLGTVLLDQSRFVEAREAFGNCVRLDEQNSSCLNNLAVAQRKAALTDSALKELKDTQTAENSAPALYLLARQYKDKGLLSEEESAYKKCVKLDAKFAPCHFGLFQIFSEAHKQPHAEAACKNFMKYGTAEEFPTEYQTCEKFLNSAAF
ncbi:tetratricopeptide repeat protein [Corallococcus sp. M34]|nr:tetratricopeptide repeat protein [Citreicoccus inhibens]